jgi:hypothetical protein
MTESEWLTSDNAESMLRSLGDAASDRKLRLLACAVARLLPPRDDPDDHRRRDEAIRLAERFADGKVGKGKLDRAWRGSWAVASPRALDSALGVNDCFLRDREEELTALVREVFGNPSRPASFDPAWRSADVQALARAAYEERLEVRRELDPVRLAVLADALEDSGCASEAILGHLRGDGPHVRGCWALDLALGKE